MAVKQRREHYQHSKLLGKLQKHFSKDEKEIGEEEKEEKKEKYSRRKGKENDDEEKDDYYEDHREDDEYEEKGSRKRADRLEGTDHKREHVADCYIKQHDENEGEPGYEQEEWYKNKSPWERKNDHDEADSQREETARSTYPESSHGGQRKIKRLPKTLDPKMDGDGYPKKQLSKEMRKNIAVLTISKKKRKSEHSSY